MTKQFHIRILLISFFVTLMLMAGGCSPSLFASYPSVRSGDQANSRDLRVHFIDVGQGDSILAESDGHFMLIDAGENDQAGIVSDYLRQAGVTTLDYVVGTHPHSDHIGGLDEIIEGFTVKTVILPPAAHTTRTFEDVLDAISNKGLKITKSVPGSTYALGNASFTIVAPARDYGDDLNNWSVGLRLSYGQNSFLMCGDAEDKAEADMVSSGMNLSADVLKAGHHGSRTSTSDAFLENVSPSYVVIQCGKGNSYGHPHKETLEKLEEDGIEVLRTDENGTIVAASDGEYITWTLSSGQAVPEGSSLIQAQAQEQTRTQAQTYILNTSTKKFHLPDCASADKIKDKNRREVSESRDQLIEHGYAPCKQCSP